MTPSLGVPKLGDPSENPMWRGGVAADNKSLQHSAVTQSADGATYKYIYTYTLIAKAIPNSTT